MGEGRVGLVGDAAYCPSPVSAMGTSLALTGAYVLAGELAGHADHGDAFRGYERVMRPYVDKAQGLPPGAPRLLYPKTGAGAKVLDLALRVASSPAAGAIGNRLSSPPAESLDLPDYSPLELAS